jgi:hypothetical protein
MRKLEALLSKNQLTPAERPNPAFESAFFRPPAGDLRQRWDALRAQRPTNPAPPQVLLLSYKESFGGSIWLLEANAAARTNAELGAQARRTFERVSLLVSRELPALVDASRSQVSWAIRRVHTAGETVLEGESFGLSLSVAAAAYHLQLPSPSHLAAIGCVASDGTVLPVDGLRAKLSILHDWALGVTTVLTSAAQSEEAGALTREIGASWRIVGVRSVGDAISCAFPNWWTDLQSRWADDVPLLKQVAHDLHRLARDGSNQLLGWRALADVAEAVASRFPSDDPARKEAQFAALVARRHEGERALLPVDGEWLASMRRPLRLRCLAHVVQSHGDCADELDQGVIGEAIQALPKQPLDDSPDDLRLLGAVGRTLAAFFRYSEAEGMLTRAVRGWFELDRAPEASHSLCELLRVTSATQQHDPFRDTVSRYAQRVLGDPRAPEVSRGFVRYWSGRGFIVLGDDARGYEYLVDQEFDWNLLPDHLRACRLRWVARVARRLGWAEIALKYHGLLEALADQNPATKFALALAELDRALLKSIDVRLAMKAFSESRPGDYSRFASAFPDEVERCRKLVDHFRY